MIRTINPGRKRNRTNFIDGIPFSEVTDKTGQPVTLRLSLMTQNGNAEMRMAAGRDTDPSVPPQPVILWLNGAGWRECPRNWMVPELQFLTEAGFAVAFCEYRHSGLAPFPAQLEDCRTAVRFLKANAAKYNLDPDRIGSMGMSAGGHLAAFLALNPDGFDTEEWKGQSSIIRAAADLFGPTDISALIRVDRARFHDPDYRWHSIPETHAGALLDITQETAPEEVFRRADAASPSSYINSSMAPLMILHGDQDPLIPLSISVDFYEKLRRAGLGSQTDLYIVKGGGHSTREFFQPSVKERICNFFRSHLS